MRRRLLALGAIIGWGACTSAMAQQAVPVVEAKRQMEFGGNFDVIHDSNIGHTNEALALTRGIHPEDWTYKPSVEFSIVEPLGRQALFLKGNVGYDFHQYNKRLNREDVDTTGGGVVTLGPCHSTIYGHYAALQSDLEDVAANLVKNTMTTVASNVAVDCGAAQGLTGQLQGLHEDVTNSADQQQKADHRSNGIFGGFGYGNASLGTLMITAAYSKQVFPNRLTDLNTFGDSYWDAMLGVSYKKTFGSRLQAEVTVGQMKLRRASAPAGIPLETKGLNYTLNLDYKPNPKLGLQVQSQRSFMPSNRPGKLYDLVTVTLAQANYNLGARFVISVGGEFEDIESNQDTAAIIPTPTTSRTKSGFASIRYRQSERASVQLALKHEDRKTDLPAFDYTNTQATLSLAVTF